MEKKSSKLLEHRNKLKAKKPEFLRTDGHKRMKLQRKWRRPAGLHNKMRLNKRGYRRSVTVGWKSPGSVRGTDRTGLTIEVVHNLQEMSRLDGTKTGIFIASTVGGKKRLDLLREAIAKKMVVFNHKDPQKFISQAMERIEAKKKESAAKKEEPKKAEEKKSLDTIADEEEKKDTEKKEKDKILTKKV